MAKKLNAATAKRVKALSINVKTEEEAREKLLEILNENGIDGMEDEDIDTLIEIAESFVEDDASGDDDGDSEEDENDELAEEVEEEEEQPKKKPAKKASKKVEEEPEEEDEEEEADEEEEETEDEGDQFDEMDRSALKSFIKENELDITVKKSMTDDDIRELIRDAVGEEEEEEEAPAPKAKASTKKAEKAAPKKEEKKAAAPAKKETKKEAKPAVKRGTKLDPKNNEEDRAAFKALKKLFPESEYAYAWVASAGVTIKHKGKNSQRSMVLIENCSKQADGSIKCNLYLLTFTKQTEVLDKAGIDYEPCWSGAPLIKAITLDEALEIIEGLMPEITATVQKIDKKLGENRKKMEDNLNKKAPKKAAKQEEVEEEEDEDDEEEEAPKKKSTKPAAKKPAKKVEEPEEEEDEDDEEEEEAPAPKKKAAAKAPVKKTTKKK